VKPEHGEQLLEIPLKQIRHDAADNLRQTNSHTEDIRDLAESIKQQGILEPLVVTHLVYGHGSTPDEYRLVFGFRRIAAAQLAGLITVPAIVRDLKPEQVTEAQLVENLQREGLNPVDEAKGLKALLESTELTQAEVGKKIGKSQPYVANRLRLLTLPQAGIDLVATGKMTVEAAKEILSVGEERAQKTVIGHAVELAKQLEGPVGEHELQYALNDAHRRAQQRREIEQARANAKFPECPAKDCGRPGTKIPWDASHSSGPKQKGTAVSKLGCSQGHEWSTSTGKLEAKHNYNTHEVTSPGKEPTKPTLPEIAPTVDTVLDAGAIARRILGGMKQIRGVSVSWVTAKTARIEISADLPFLRQSKVPSFGSREERGKKVSLEFAGAESWNQRSDVGRKHAAEARRNLEAWLATFGRNKGGA
jgi:ParB/RepB/Spo0J family partition protein